MSYPAPDPIAPPPPPPPPPAPKAGLAPAADWSLTIVPDTDVRERHGYTADCSCGYQSPLQTGLDAVHNVAMAAMQHIHHAHAPRLSDPRYDTVGVEVAELKHYGWGWHCFLCEETEKSLGSEENARSRAADHGRQYRHHRRAAA